MTGASRRGVPDTVPEIPAYDPAVSDSGPQKALRLAEAGMTQAEIARELDRSQSTVSRWLQLARDQRKREIHYRAIARDLFLVIVTICAVVITLAVATIAWG